MEESLMEWEAHGEAWKKGWPNVTDFAKDNTKLMIGDGIEGSTTLLAATHCFPLQGMAYLSQGNPNCSALCSNGTISFMGISAFPPLIPKVASVGGFIRAAYIPHGLYKKETSLFLRKCSSNTKFNKAHYTIPSCSGSSESHGSQDDSSVQPKAPFGYTRKDVLLIGIGVTVFGIGLKSGLEYGGVDPLQAGNVVQLVLVLGLTVGWISTYIFRVSNKEMTYVQQLRDYEDKVMEKRLEGLTEAELEALLEQVEEEKSRIARGEQVN